jgi:hypothetical protein
MKNTKNFFKIMSIVSAAMLLFAVNANAGSAGEARQLSVNSQKMAKISKPRAPTRAPTFERLAVPDRLELAGLSPQPEPPDLPSAVANPTGMAKATPLPDPPTTPVIVKNPATLGGINPQPEPPRQRYFMTRYLKLRGQDKHSLIGENGRTPEVIGENGKTPGETCEIEVKPPPPPQPHSSK